MTGRYSLEHDGFEIVARVIARRDVGRLIDAVESLSLSPSALSRGGGVYAMRNLLQEVPETRRLAESEPIRTLVAGVLGPRCFVVRGLLFDKTPEANWTVPWHQDLTIAVKERTSASGYGPWTLKAGVTHTQPPVSVLERMVTVRVQLDECTESQGPLRVVPGSHAEGRLSAEATRRWLERVGPIPCLVPSGGVLLMRPLILHASSPASEPGHRRVVHLEYAADPLPGGVEWFERMEIAQ